MKKLGVLLIAVALIAGLVGCAAGPIWVDLTISSTSGGSVSAPGEGTFTYEAGAVVDLIAVPNQCCEFVSWIGDTVGDPDSATTTITMDAAKSVTANFALRMHELTVEPESGGSVIEPGGGVFSYACGTTVTLVAEADPGYRFLNWTGDVDTIDDSTSIETTITMNENYSIGASFRAVYSTSDTLVEGLTRPRINARDGQGRIYFTEFDRLLNEDSISRFDPDTGEVVRLIEHVGGQVMRLSLDAQENLYYMLRYGATNIRQVRRLSPRETESLILFTDEHLDQRIVELTVDRAGNVYFGLQCQSTPRVELRQIPAGNTTSEPLLVLEGSSRILNINVADDLGLLYFTSAAPGFDRIYRFNLESAVLDTVLEKTDQNNGAIGQLASCANGDVYYLYRQRSGDSDPVESGYLEIGRLTIEALETGQPPELLVADELDREVWVWGGSPHCFAVSDTGDVFFNIILVKEGSLAQAPQGIYWFDHLTRDYVALVEGITEEGEYTFLLDNEGSLYYAAPSQGAIIRVNR